MIWAIAAALILMVVVMASAWLTQKLTRNAGWVDVFWTFGTGIAGVALSLWPDPSAVMWRQIMVALLIAIWSLRLGLHVATRVAGTPEDARYVELRQEWGGDFDRRMFWFLQIQSVISALLGIAIFLAAHNPVFDLRIGDVAGGLVLAIGIFGEAAADGQLRRFRADPANRGRLCTVGLWAWSRHPNYFFEWLLWLAYPLIAFDPDGANPYGWLALIAPLIMYWVLVYATGVPYLEKRMARSYAAQFEAYRQRTSAFFLWPPKEAA